MIRSIIAVGAGFLWWGAVCVTVNNILFVVAPGAFDPVTWGTFDPGMNVLLLCLTVGYSVSSGYVTAWIAGRKELTHALALGLWNLAFGTLVQIANWHTQPVWYHLIFLALLVPGIVAGGWLRAAHKRARRVDPSTA